LGAGSGAAKAEPSQSAALAAVSTLVDRSANFWMFMKSPVWLQG
jgi:hypothetical protein